MRWTGSIFDTAGSQAERIALLGWLIIATAAVVYVLVLTATAIAVRRARHRSSRDESADTGATTEKLLTRRIGVATADLYPRITLGGSVGSTGNTASNLFEAGPLNWVIGPLLNWAFPNMEAGRARVAQAEASTRAALATFDGAVLKALQETETALSAYAHTVERRRALQAELGQARVAARISRAQLREGRADSLAVLDSERTLAGAEADLAGADALVAASQIDLFRALGGGWQTPRATL